MLSKVPLPSSYLGARYRPNCVTERPINGLFKLLHDPSIVRYLEILQSGSGMQELSRAVPAISSFCVAIPAAAFVKFNLCPKRK